MSVKSSSAGDRMMAGGSCRVTTMAGVSSVDWSATPAYFRTDRDEMSSPSRSATRGAADNDASQTGFVGSDTPKAIAQSLYGAAATTMSSRIARSDGASSETPRE